MSETPATTPVVLNPEITKAIQDATNPADIRAAIIAEAAKRRDAAADTAAADAAAAAKTAEDAAKVAADAEAAKVAAAAAPAAEGFIRTETIGGKELTFSAGSELELERMVNNAFKVAYALQDPGASAPDPAREAAAAAAAAQAEVDRAAAKADLELKFKRGDISAQDYIEQSGAIKDYLEKQGIPLDELRESVEKNRSRGFEQSWEEATQEFLKGPGSQDWPGGEANREIIGMKIAALGLVDAEDKVAALAQAWASMKSTGAYVRTEAAAAAAPAAAADAAKTAADAAKAAADAAAATTAAATAAVAAAAATPARTAPTSSSLFGASSGPGGAGTAERAAAASKVEIPKDASPQEILEAWKQEQIKKGIDPNAAFRETFSRPRS